MKKATFTMQYDRVIDCFIKTESDGYYEVQIHKVHNPCSKKHDWKKDEIVKISKSLIIKTEWKN